MKLGTNVFDLWVFRRDPDEVRYLLLHTSQEKADKWFGGGRFWQILGGFIEEEADVVEALRRILTDHDLAPKSLWAIEHVYTIYNRRRKNIEIIPVFAAEIKGSGEVPLSWEHSEYRWLTAEECRDRINFRGLREGLDWMREYITENEDPGAEFRLA